MTTAAKPGAIQMRKGKWRIYTNLRGFRPQWMPLDYSFVCSRMAAYTGLCRNPLEECRVMGWIDRIKIAETDDQKKAVIKDMRYIAGKKPETRFQRAASEWAQWLHYLTMIKCKVEN